jgi:hypothetical protein
MGVRVFPTKLGEEVPIIRERDGGHHLACSSCEAELDSSRGEWVADYPDRPIHGYRISQLFSSKIDSGEILREYRKTYNPARFLYAEDRDPLGGRREQALDASGAGPLRGFGAPG